MAKKGTTNNRRETDNKRREELDGSRGHRPRPSQIPPKRDTPKSPPPEKKGGDQKENKK